MESRGMTEDDVRARMAAQTTDEQRRAAADVWLDNSGTKDELRHAVEELWHERLVPFEHNVRHGIRAQRSDDLVLHPHDPTWPAQAHRLLERLRLAFGDTLVTADHIGSTAVAGLAAKDVIDLQVGVDELRAADDPALLDRLARAGFPRPVDAPRADNAKDGGAWPKRFHGAADPGRPVHLHVREVGSPGWRWALLFRDWLRADGAVCGEYAAEKLRIAATGVGVSRYADAKEPWFDGVAARAEEWARENGWEPVRG
jgi:dephospho-CoA kinase